MHTMVFYHEIQNRTVKSGFGQLLLLRYYSQKLQFNRFSMRYSFTYYDFQKSPPQNS